MADEVSLFEREKETSVLNRTLAESADGHGQMVLISGEAGIGKTSLIDHFVSGVPPDIRLLRGACDPLFTPHPLAPVRDIARQVHNDQLSKALASGERLSIFSTLLQEVQRGPEPTLIIVEDVHWADEATLDLILYLSRRLLHTTAVLLVSYRDDELAADHPLWRVLGHMAGPHIKRLKLQPLSRQAVERLARQRGRSAAGLYALTGGNPFYVIERLASISYGVPATIREAVKTRVVQLPREAREVLELASVVPRLRVEHWIIQNILDPNEDLLQTCASSGVIRMDQDAIIFRHELTRLAVAESLPVHQRVKFHTLILQQLLDAQDEDRSVSLAHIVHHARQIRDLATVRKYAPKAAQEASALGSHQEAAAHYQTLLDFADELPLEDYVLYLEKLAYEYYLTTRIEGAIELRQRALAIREQLNQTEAIGANLRWLSRLIWLTGQTKQALDYARRSIQVLEENPPGFELTMAYSNYSQLNMLATQPQRAVEVGMKALELIETGGYHDILSHVLNNLGSAQWQLGERDGRQKLIQSLELALQLQQQEHAARAFCNISSFLIEDREYEEAMKYLEEGLEYCTDRDLDLWHIYMRGWRARLFFEQGAWQQAEAEATDVVTRYQHAAAILRLPALATLAHLKIRRGDPDAQDLLDQSLALVRPTRAISRIGNVMIAYAEAAWLRGALSSISADLMPVYEEAVHGDRQTAAALRYWLVKAGGLQLRDPVDEHPFSLLVAGDWRSAAKVFSIWGCPFEQALALSEGDLHAQKDAIRLFDQMGAAPAARLLRTHLREQDIRGVPRGPRPETRENPGGLTPRQFEVLNLLVAGLTDQQIADELFISPKTVGHHVSAVLAKLEVESRQQAAQRAVDEGWLSDVEA